jgi:hypothetical protein
MGTLPSLKKVKRLPAQLEEALSVCYRRQLASIEPIVICPYNTTSALIERGMLSAKTFVKRKKVMFGFYVTALGIDYLSQL